MTKSAIEWKRLNAHCIESGDWCITKALVNGQAKYTLYKGTVRIGVFDSAQAAMDAA